MFGGHIFDRFRKEYGIEQPRTKTSHPGPNGQAERMNPTVKNATLRAFHYPPLVAVKARMLEFNRATALPNTSKQ